MVDCCDSERLGLRIATARAPSRRPADTHEFAQIENKRRLGEAVGRNAKRPGLVAQFRTARRHAHSGSPRGRGLKQRIGHFPIPEDLRGQRVLDIGTWDGWYAFEMERRGAAVLAIDNWDNPRFREVHALLGSRVEYRRMDMWDLTPERVGRFDVVLFMGVLYHLKHPLLALERVCALTTGMAAVESFVLRDSERPGENVEKRPLMEFYETDEFGGQTDNWIGPSLACLTALCRTAGFARVELGNVSDYGASVACYRKWQPSSSSLWPAPTLLRVEHNTHEGASFDSRHDEYVSAWFNCDEEDLGLDDVKPEVGGYGARPIYVSQLEDGSWQTNFKLPPGLEAGWHDAAIRLGDGPASNARRVSVDLVAEEPPLSIVAAPEAGARKAGLRDTKPIDVQKVVSEIHARIRREENPESLSLHDSYELAALRNAYQRLYQSRNAVGKMPPSPNTLRARIGGLLVRGVQRCLFWYTPQILQFQNDAVNALDSACTLIGRQSERTTALEKGAQKLRREALNNTRELIGRESEKIAGLELQVHELRQEVANRATDLIGRQSETIAALEQELQKLRREVSNLKLDVIRPAAHNGVEPGLPNSFEFALQDRFRGSEAETAGKLQIYLETLRPLLPAIPGAQWLDIGCGRGEWLEAVAKLGYNILGLDSNPAAVDHCREKGLNAQETDALGYLRSLGHASAAVITAFHVVEHWPMQSVLTLARGGGPGSETRRAADYRDAESRKCADGIRQFLERSDALSSHSPETAGIRVRLRRVNRN